MKSNPFPYFDVTSALPSFVTAVRRSVPSAPLDQWATANMALKPSIAGSTVSTLKKLGLLNDSGLTELGTGFRTDAGMAASSSQILSAIYHDLEDAYAAAGDGDEGVDNYLRAYTDLGDLARTRVRRTFKQLRDMAGGQLPNPVRRAMPPRSLSKSPRNATHRGVNRVDEAGGSGMQEVSLPVSNGVLRITAPKPLRRPDLERIMGVLLSVLVLADGD